MWISLNETRIRWIAIIYRLILIIHGRTRDLLITLKNRPIAGHVIGVHIFDAKALKIANKGLFLLISGLSCRDRVKNANCSNAKEENYKREKGYTRYIEQS